MPGDVVQPYAIENEDGRFPAVLVVDHASNAIPAALNGLGLDPDALTAHVAWDPGAIEVARAMSRSLDAPLVYGTLSRLVLDLNRPTTSTTLIPTISETTSVPGNVGLSREAVAARIAAIHEPYHAALAGLIDRHAEALTARGGPAPAIVAIHTFTPVYKGVHRPLHVGVLFDRDDRLGRAMLADLRGEPGLVAEANQPYSPADEVYHTLERHAVSRGLMNVMIEIRNDEVREAAAQQAWADRLGRALARTVAEPVTDGTPRRQAGARPSG